MVLALLPVLMSHLYYWMTGRVGAKVVDLRFIKLCVVSCISVGPQCRASYEFDSTASVGIYEDFETSNLHFESRVLCLSLPLVSIYLLKSKG